MAKKDPKVTQKIRNRIEKFDKYWRINREQYHEWIGFVMGDQWREDESRLFERYNKIPLTFNKLGALTNHMIGEQRQNTPTLQVVPDESVPEQTAEVRSALVKNISLDSNTSVIYQHAYQCALIGGYGAFGIKTKYEDTYSTDKVIEIYRINDPTKAYWDVSAETICKTDGMSAGIRTRMSRRKFRGIYGKKVESNIGADSLNNDVSLNFADDDSITIIDDYERSYDTIKIYKLSNNKTIDEDEFNQLERTNLDGIEMIMYEGEPVTILEERDSDRYKIKHRKIAGQFILDETDFPSEQLPIVFVDQNSYWDKNGQQICRPFFKDVKDAQRYLNYLATQSAYILKVSRYDQFIASKANVKGADTEQMWRDPSIIQGALFYDESPNGNKPERLSPPELSQSLSTQYERTMMDIQTGTGLYNTQMGEVGNEISGTAVTARSRRGSLNTFVTRDALDRSVACCGQIVNEMIPRVYDSERLMMLKMDDGNIKPVTLNKPLDDYGNEIENDMTKGRYRIRLVPGVSYEGQKQEAVESMQMILQNDPTLFKLIGDLYVENLPLSNNIELRNRIRTIIPPEVIEAGKTGKSIQQKQQPDPQTQLASMQAQLAQQELQFKMQDAQMKAQLKMKELEMKQQDLNLRATETGQNIQMEWQKLQNEKDQIAANLQDQILRYQAEIQKTNMDANISHGQNLVKILTHHPKEPKQNNINTMS
jgi:hypothetical protein